MLAKKKTTSPNSAATRRRNVKDKNTKAARRSDSDSISVNSKNSVSSCSILKTKIYKSTCPSSKQSVGSEVSSENGKTKDVRNCSIDSSSIPVSITSSNAPYNTPARNCDKDKAVSTIGYNTPPNSTDKLTTLSNGTSAYKMAGSTAVSKPNPPDLASIGIRPAKSPPRYAGRSTTNSAKDCKMRVAVIKCCASETAAIVMRCEPLSSMQNSSNAAWSEKVFSDALGSETKRTENWVTHLAISTMTYPWFDNNVKQRNNKGFPIRLFVMYADLVPTHNAVYKFCQSVCDCLNATPGNTTKISVDEKKMFWLPGNNAVWSDIVGNTKSCEMITYDKGEPKLGFYEEYEDEILTHFHYGSFDLDLAAYFYAPVATLHPSINRDNFKGYSDYEQIGYE
jgi:hypothetical protein